MPGRCAFRVIGSEDLERRLPHDLADVVLATSGGRGTLCLVTVAPGDLRAFGAAIRSLAAEGAVRRVEAEPQL